MHSKLIQIATELRTRFLDESQNPNEMSIFLCGGAKREEEKFRRAVGERLSAIRSKYTYSVYYPEDMFTELILGHQRKDLLTLENLLANGANAVVILLQSPGTFTELGAFTNYAELQDKLIVVMDPKFKRARSFINRGPIRYLRLSTKSKVLYRSMVSADLEQLVKEVARAARAVSKWSRPTRDLTNPTSVYRFYLALIYVFEPVSKTALITMSKRLADNEQTTAATAAETVVNSLIRERKITFGAGGLTTTSKGSHNLIYGYEAKKKARGVLSFLTEYRLQALNLTLRRNPSKVWGEAKRS